MPDSSKSILDDMDPEILPIARRAIGLREQNGKLFQEFEQLGGGVDVGPARTEHLINFLVEAGILTEKQKWEEAVAWEEAVRTMVTTATEQIKAIRQEAIEEYERQQRLAALSSGILGQPKR